VSLIVVVGAAAINITDSVTSVSEPVSQEPIMIHREPASPYAFETLETLQEMIVPENDLRELAGRFEGKGEIPLTLDEPAVIYAIGDREMFLASNLDTDEYFEIYANLEYMTEHTYFWVQEGVEFDEGDMKLLADTFDESIYPTVRSFFGSEWLPGVDNDPRLYILYAEGLGFSVAGYFSSLDSVHPLAHEFSNAHEMIYFNADAVKFDEGFTYGVLAHEFQHMIHWNQDKNEATWLNEGFSELAMYLSGYDPGGFDRLYTMNPDIQLNTWPEDNVDTNAHYGASFLFVTYFLERFGDEVTKVLIAHQQNGMESIDRVLADFELVDSYYGNMIQADDVFQDWVLANYLLDETIADGRYAYQSYPDAPRVNQTENVRECDNTWWQGRVNQYGVDYFRISCHGTYMLTFEGSTEVDVIPADAFSGDYAFWSNKGDDSDMTLTRSFDFSAEAGPLTLEFWTWYDLEVDYDYLYLLASEDGENWEIITTPSGTNEDPYGNSYGWAYNGVSAGWIKEVVDISEYAGKEVYLRFEYITDAGANGEGMQIDDVAVPETGYFSDFESDEGGWEADGFVRIQNRLPQTFAVSLIYDRGGEVEVEIVELNADQGFSKLLELELGDEVVLAVSGTTRYIIIPADYQFKLE
jgi:hypothetical protein